MKLGNGSTRHEHSHGEGRAETVTGLSQGGLERLKEQTHSVSVLTGPPSLP